MVTGNIIILGSTRSGLRFVCRGGKCYGHVVFNFRRNRPGWSWRIACTSSPPKTFAQHTTIAWFLSTRGVPLLWKSRPSGGDSSARYTMDRTRLLVFRRLSYTNILQRLEVMALHMVTLLRRSLPRGLSTQTLSYSPQLSCVEPTNDRGNESCKSWVRGLGCVFFATAARIRNDTCSGPTVTGVYAHHPPTPAERKLNTALENLLPFQSGRRLSNGRNAGGERIADTAHASSSSSGRRRSSACFSLFFCCAGAPRGIKGRS